MKKSYLSEYSTLRNIGVKAISLDEGDEIVDVIYTDSDNVGVLTSNGNFIIVTTTDIRPIGRVARGIKAIKLNADDYVVSARLVPSDTKAIISISGNGLFKQTPFTEFTTQGKNTKGAKLQKLTEGDFMADFYPLTTETDLLFASTRSCIRLSVAEVPTYSTGAQGNKSIKLSPVDNIVKITNC
jgi:DNA gyrase subunit A